MDDGPRHPNLEFRMRSRPPLLSLSSGHARVGQEEQPRIDW